MTTWNYVDSALDLWVKYGGVVCMRRFGRQPGAETPRISLGLVVAGASATLDLTPDEADKVADALKVAAQAQREGRPGYELPIRP